MGNPYSKPEDRLRFINREVNALRSSIRTSKQNMSKNKKEFIVQTLAQHSSDVSSLNGKIKRRDIEGVLKNISEVMEEVLKIETNELDGGAVESDSFINVPLSKKRSNSLGSLNSKKANKIQLNRSSIPTLRDIEAKVDELKTQINTAINNRDVTQLRVFKQTLTVLAADLELLRVELGTPIEKRKENVSRKIVSLYQKVTRSLNDFKNDQNQKNRSKQQQKQHSLNELSDIELRLAENETLLDKMIKQKNGTNFHVIRNNIVENNQRLAKVDIVDNDIKERVVLLSQKLTETVKNLDQIMAKREFDSKFSKSLENFDRIIKNHDSNANSQDTIMNLKSLRNSLENLEEINDKTKNRKKDLLTQINNKVDDIASNISPSDKKIVEDLVEDNVVLRKKIKSMDKEHTVIDQFVNYWTNVKGNFNVNAYSHLSLLRIDQILEEMQESINDIRIQIAKKCDMNLPNHLIRKHSQSMPKLNRASFGSTKSTEKIIKTKAKVYELASPQKQDNAVQRRFSKIEEMKMQVHYIKEKIDDTPNRQLLKDKLELYRKNLQEYSSDSNQVVANSANILANEIVELLHKTVLADLKDHVELLSKHVHQFNGTRYDQEFQQLQVSLLKLQVDVENFSVPLKYEQLLQEKGEILDEIRTSIDSLQEKGSYYRKFENDKVKLIKEKVQQLNDKVKRFSGTYKGVMYNQIERDLNKLLVDVEEQVEDKVWQSEIVKETERLLKILEQRSSLAQSFKTGKLQEFKSDPEGITKIKSDLINIKKEIDKTPDTNVEAFLNFQSRLDLVNFELSQISARSNENLAKEKEIYSNEAQTLKNVVDAKVALGQQPVVVQWTEAEQGKPVTYAKTDVNKEIEQFETNFSNIKQKIKSSTYQDGGRMFLDLASEIKQLMETLESYRFIRGTDLYVRQLRIVDEMQFYVDALQKEADDIGYITKAEHIMDNFRRLIETGHPVDVTSLKQFQKEIHERPLNPESEVLKNRQSRLIDRANSLLRNVNDLKVIHSKTIDDVEKTIKALAPDVENFNGQKDDQNYRQLNERAESGIDLLNNLYIDSPALQRRRSQLLQDLQHILKALDTKTTNTDEINQIQKALDEVQEKQTSFSGKQHEIDAIKNQIEDIRTRLVNFKADSGTAFKKTALKDRLTVLFNKTLTLHATSTMMSTFSSNHPLINIGKQLESIEKELKTTSDAVTLQAFDTTLTDLKVQLRKLPQDVESDRLHLKIDDITDLVEEKLQDIDRLTSIDEEIEDITGKSELGLSQEEANRLDQRLNHLLLDLRKIRNPELKSKVDGSALRIMLASNKIAEFMTTGKSTSV